MLIVIPARYASTRFPGKPLVPILGKPLIQWTWEAAMKVAGAEVVVATDDARIQAVAEGFGASVVRTSSHCRNGTERVAEAVDSMLWHDTTDVVVNWQGDALMVEAPMVERTAQALLAYPNAVVATPVVSLVDLPEGTVSAGHVDVWVTPDAKALWFSREAVLGGPVLAHVGIYAYRRDALRGYVGWPEGIVERRVGLEQLRWLENGADMRCVPFFPFAPPREVNYPEDVAVVERVLQARGFA
jgi:3-deoxy-manno-octulosonate cytidylyltransferase (CMP-KDO synthetase)